MKRKDKDSSSTKNTNNSNDNLHGVIASLKSLIDKIDSNFRKPKDLISELARRLYEESVALGVAYSIQDDAR